MEVINHIEIRDGEGYLLGRNLKAEMVARMVVGTDYTLEEVMGHYQLHPAELHAALAYYYDHQDILDARHEAAIQWAAEHGQTLAKLKQKTADQKQAGTGS